MRNYFQMTKIRIHEIDNMSRENQDKLLFELIQRGDRGFFRFNLQRFNIPNRTKIYNLGGWSFKLYNDTRDVENFDEFWENRKLQFRDGCKTLLNFSQIEDWYNSFLYDIPIRVLQSIMNTEFGIKSLTINTVYEN